MTKALTKDGQVTTISPQSEIEETPQRSTHSLEDLIGDKLGKHKVDVYRGVVIFWVDKPSDDVLDFIDQLKGAYRGRLVLLRLQDDALSLAWRGAPPPDLSEGSELQGPAEGQQWHVVRSVQVA